MEILPQISEIIQTEILPFFPLQKQHRIKRGIALFGLTPFCSINSAGRLIDENRKTGESYVYRLLRDDSLTQMFLRHFWNSFHNKETLYLSIDFSDINAFLQLACLVMTTFNGRALPLWVKAYPKQPKKGTMILRLIKMLKEFLKYRKPNIQIIICMDRWFNSPRFLRFLNERNIIFICRMKSCTQVRVPWRDDPTEVLDISRPDTFILHHDIHTRLILSKWKPSMKDEEPWFLLTNDLNMGKQKILMLYRKRFEIEEFFKDMKWIQRFEWLQVKTEKVLETLFTFILFGWWLIYKVRKTMHMPWGNPKLRLSWFRRVWEILARERFLLAFHPPN